MALEWRMPGTWLLCWVVPKAWRVPERLLTQATQCKLGILETRQQLGARQGMGSKMRLDHRSQADPMEQNNWPGHRLSDRRVC